MHIVVSSPFWFTPIGTASAALLNTSSHQSFAHGVDDAFSDQQRGDLLCLERKVWAKGRGRKNLLKSKIACREGNCLFFMDGQRTYILRRHWTWIYLDNF